MPLAALILDAAGLVDGLDTASRRMIDAIRPDLSKSDDDARAYLSQVGVPELAADRGVNVQMQAAGERMRRAHVDAVRAGPLPLRDGARALVDGAAARGLRVAVLGAGADWFDAMDVGSNGALRSLGTVVTDPPGLGLLPAKRLRNAAAALGLFGTECAVVTGDAVTLGGGRNAGVVGAGIVFEAMVPPGADRADPRWRRMAEGRLRGAGARTVHPSLGALAADLDAALDRLAPGTAPVTRGLAEQLMREALAVAREGMAAGEAPIGCVLARGDGTIIARGYNEMNRTQNKTAHAEIVTFARAAGRVPLDARDLIMASTLEPCVMCTGAAMEAAVDTIVYALRAPADSGTGRVHAPESPESQMPRIVGDVLAAESRTLFEEWMRQHGSEPQAAYVRQLLALTR